MVHFWRACHPWPVGHLAGCMPSEDTGETSNETAETYGAAVVLQTPQEWRTETGRRNPKPERNASPWTIQGSGEVWGALQNVGTPRYMTQFPRGGYFSEAWGTKQDNPWENTPHSPQPVREAGPRGQEPGCLGSRARGAGRALRQRGDMEGTTGHVCRTDQADE